MLGFLGKKKAAVLKAFEQTQVRNPASPPIQLTSLQGAPTTVLGDFQASANLLTSLERPGAAPAAEAIAQPAPAALDTQSATVLQSRITVGSPLKFKGA